MSAANALTRRRFICSMVCSLFYLRAFYALWLQYSRSSGRWEQVDMTEEWSCETHNATKSHDLILSQSGASVSFVYPLSSCWGPSREHDVSASRLLYHFDSLPVKRDRRLKCLPLQIRMSPKIELILPTFRAVGPTVPYGDLMPVTTPTPTPWQSTHCAHPVQAVHQCELYLTFCYASRQYTGRREHPLQTPIQDLSIRSQ